MEGQGTVGAVYLGFESVPPVFGIPSEYRVRTIAGVERVGLGAYQGLSTVGSGPGQGQVTPSSPVLLAGDVRT